MSEITKTEFERYLSGYNITDCAIRDRNAFYFICREDYTKWPVSKWDPEEEPAPDEEDVMKNVLSYIRVYDHGKRLGRTLLQGFTRTMIGGSAQPDSKAVAVSLTGHVFATGKGKHEIEEPMRSFEQGGPSRGGITRLRTIDGSLYFCGGRNSAGKRTGKNQWQSLTQHIPDPPRQDHRFNTFEDIDGFSERDIYCVGSEGQVFHYNGSAWRQLSLPTNAGFETVCCAGDNFVYISSDKGDTYKGRDNRWKLISQQKMSLPFRDMVWHEDRVWCTSDYGVWTIKDDVLSAVSLPDGMNAYAGNLAAGHGVLLLAGYGGAAFLENGRWTRIFSVAEMSRG
jgi:hypothetical protein